MKRLSIWLRAVRANEDDSWVRGRKAIKIIENWWDDIHSDPDIEEHKVDFDFKETQFMNWQPELCSTLDECNDLTLGDVLGGR